MAILLGFPPSNCISPTTWITERDLSQPSLGGLGEARTKFMEYERKFKVAPAKPLTKEQQNRYHAGNIWVQRKEFGKSYQYDIEAMFSRLASFGMSIGVGESLMNELVKLALDAHEVFMYDRMGCYKSEVTWFLWLEYHLVHALSVQFQTDLRPVWLKTWQSDGVPWVRERMNEDLNVKTPLMRRLKEIRPERCGPQTCKLTPRNVIATKKL